MTNQISINESLNKNDICIYFNMDKPVAYGNSALFLHSIFPELKIENIRNNTGGKSELIMGFSLEKILSHLNHCEVLIDDDCVRIVDIKRFSRVFKSNN